MNDTDTYLLQIDKRLQMVEVQLDRLKGDAEVLEDEAALEEREQEIRVVTQQLGDLLIARKIQQTLLSSEHREKEDAFVKEQPKRYRWDRWREVAVRMTNGTPVKLGVRYASRAGVQHRRLKRGLYPGLILLGIYEHCTPGRASEVAQLVVALGSFKEAERHLRSRGSEVELKRMRRIARQMAQRARLAQQVEAVPLGESVAGRQVVIATDGGRIRIRVPKRGRRTAKGRHGYYTPWKEPKLLIVYTIDANGRQDKRFSPWIDGTLRGPDVLFTWLGTYLENLRIGQADRVLFISDGALWIWKRVRALIERLRLRPEQVVQAVDFYHAVEHLTTVSNEVRWSEELRKRWVREQRRWLRKGRVGQVLDAIDRLRRSRGHSAVLKRERNYFLNNRERMRYDQLKASHLPLGSGAVESAIRRVINLRLKGAGLFWNKDTAEEMLMLRAFYKAGRWNILKKLAFTPASPLLA